MDKIIGMQRGKSVGSYGGPDSIIETPHHGSLRIDRFDCWPVYKRHLTGGRNGAPTAQGVKLIFNDSRLEHRLSQLGYTSLKGLFLPEIEFSDNIESKKYDPSNDDVQRMISASYFPKWFYCPKCRKMHTYDEWESLWISQFPNDGKFRNNAPACPNCSTRSAQKIRRRDLQQVRFALASMDNGDMIDMPWNQLPYATIANDVVSLNGQSREVEYRTSPGKDGLDSIIIKADDNHSINLGKLSSSYFMINGAAYKMVIKNATNIYFPIIESSIQIPVRKYTDDELQTIQNTYQNLSQYVNAGNLKRAIVDNLGIQQPAIVITEEKLDELVANNFHEKVATRIDDVLEEEYDYITNNNNYDALGMNDASDDFGYVAEHQQIQGLPTRIQDIYSIRLLKEISVEVGYTRMYPSEKNDASLSFENVEKSWYDVVNNCVKSPSKLSIMPVTECRKSDVKYMLASKSSGEGLFLKLDVNDITTMENTRLTYIHTLSHIIMKELEFQCGYSLTSLKERLYVLDTKGKFAIMIYTAGGEDGCYGGLSSLYPDKIVDIINAAVSRAKHCPTDPICEGHCFACTDIPETSCTMGNKLLYRPIFLSYHR